MPRKPWQVWSIAPDEKTAMAVAEGTRRECEAIAERNTAAAGRLKVAGRFEALPPGASPEGFAPR